MGASGTTKIHGKEESKHFFLMPPVQNPPHARGNQSSFLLLSPEQGRSLDLLCLPQCPAHLTQINLSQPSWWHHKGAAQEPQGKVCQQEMPEPGVRCDPPIPAFLAALKFLLGSLHQASCVVDRPGFDRQGVTNAPKSLSADLWVENWVPQPLGQQWREHHLQGLLRALGNQFLGAHPQGRGVSADTCKGAEPSAVGLFLL